jgi:hypothetical protein
MKRAYSILLAILLTFSLAACSNQPTKTTGNAAKDASSTAASDAASASSTATSSTAASGSAVTSSATASGAAASSAAPAKKPSSEYRHKTEKYTYDQNNRKYNASYPQLSNEAQNYQKANELLKNTALQSIRAAGEGKTDLALLIRVKGKFTLTTKNFFSATYEETSQTASKEPVTAFRTLNFDLKNGKALTTADMIKQSDALNALVLKKAQSSVDSSLKSAVTADVIKNAMKSCSLYFEKTKIGFSLPVSQKLKGHIEVELKYEEVKPYMTNNALWKEITATK